MTVQLFTVYDAAARMYLEPFHAKTVEFALRQFRSTVEQGEHMFAKYPEDYTLFLVGEFDCETAILTPLAAPQSLGNALQFVDTPAELEINA